MKLYKDMGDFIFAKKGLGTLLLRPTEYGWECKSWKHRIVLDGDIPITIKELFEKISPEQVLRVVDKHCKSL